MMLILLISYYGLYPLFVSFEFSTDSFDGQLFNVQLKYRYSQAGTPRVKVTSSYNAETRTFSLKFRYTCWDFSFSFLVENHNLPHWLVILLTNSV